MSSAPAEPVIVVGVDGSPSSKDALRWAARYAELTGAAVHALIAWQLSRLDWLLPVWIGAAMGRRAAARAGSCRA